MVLFYAVKWINYSIISIYSHFLVAKPKIPLYQTHSEQINFIMSKHSSLKAQGSAQGKRSVMKRFERVKALKERGQWAEGQSPTGLPKTKVTE